MLNAARSQAAEAFFKYYIKGTPLEGQWQVESAGQLSKDHLNPYVMEILAQKGVSMEGQYSKKIDFSKLRSYDRIISFVPFAKGGLHDEDKAKIKMWIIADPLGRPFEDTRDIVNMIEVKVKELIKELTS